VVRCFSSRQPSTRISGLESETTWLIAPHDNEPITPESAHDFFVASAGIAGALIGLLFVALSVAPERVLGPEASEVHGVRATATLTAFTNALAVSLFALVPGYHPGGAATAVAILGILFIARTLLGVTPAWRAGHFKLRDLSFLAGQFVAFVFQLIAAIKLDGDPGSLGDLQTICVIVVVCFLIGIERAWELVGGPHFDIGIFFAWRRRERHDDE
jgi:hypothetical protein